MEEAKRNSIKLGLQMNKVAHEQLFKVRQSKARLGSAGLVIKPSPGLRSTLDCIGSTQLKRLVK